MKSKQTLEHGALLALAAVALIGVPRPAAAGSWNVSNVPELVAAINAANRAGGANTINLARHATFTLTAVNNMAEGPTGLPAIAGKDNLTIFGNGATIVRSLASGIPAFRLFYVAPGAALTLQDLTLANGLVIGDTGKDACGGAILNAAKASLSVMSCKFVGNQVFGGSGAGDIGGWGLGGAIWNGGIANLDGNTFSSNQAVAGETWDPKGKGGGGGGFGGAVSSASDGTLTVGNCLFTGNKAIGGFNHTYSFNYTVGGSGAIDTWGAALITDSTFTDNQALGGGAGPGVNGGFAIGGAISSGNPRARSPVCTIRNCAFRHNQALAADAGSPDVYAGQAAGGALQNGFSQGAATMAVTDCEFTGNQAIGGNGGGRGHGGGGALNIETSPFSKTVSSTTLSNCTFTANRAVGRGVGLPSLYLGAGYGAGGAIATIEWQQDDGHLGPLLIADCAFTDNEALGAPGGTYYGYGASGAVDANGNTTILRSVFKGNRAIGGPLAAGAVASNRTLSSGGALTSWNGTLDLRDSSFVGNQVIGGDRSLGGPPSAGMGGGIAVFYGYDSLRRTIINCSLCDNAAVGGAGGGATPGAAGLGGGLGVLWGAVAVTDTTLSYNQAIGGAPGGQAVGGGYASGVEAFFGFENMSSVTLNGGSVVTNNVPDDAFQF
jgi:hypothetical protein